MWPVPPARLHSCIVSVRALRMCGWNACRVHTLAMAVVEDAPSLFRAADGGATLALLAKLTVETAQQCKMEEARLKLQVHPCPNHVSHPGPSMQ